MDESAAWALSRSSFAAKEIIGRTSDDPWTGREWALFTAMICGIKTVRRRRLKRLCRAVLASPQPDRPHPSSIARPSQS